MIICVSVMAYLISCEYPAHPPVDVSSTAIGSTQEVVTLRFARCSYCRGTGFDVLLLLHTPVLTETSHSSQNHCTCDNTSTYADTYEGIACAFAFASHVMRHSRNNKNLFHTGLR
jgi:hypothetical protein